MLINASTLTSAFNAFKTVYDSSFNETPSQYNKIAMTVPSSTSQQEYGWLGQFPQLRKWIGDRHIKSLSSYGFAIKNEDFESTIAIGENEFADDQYGVFKPMFQEMARAAKVHPDTLVFGLLKAGFATKCFDGQFFFDIDHPLYDAAGQISGSVSNMQAGGGAAWYLLDLSRAIKPLIWQERQRYRFRALDRETDENVFMRKELIYGVDARVNVGFGLWQLAFGSKAALTRENFIAARNTMSDLRGDQGTLLGIQPTHLVVPPSLQDAAKEMLKANLAGGESNIFQNAVEIIVSHHVG